MAYTVTLNGVTASSDPTASIVLSSMPTGVGVGARIARVARPSGGNVPQGRDVPDSGTITVEAVIHADTDSEVVELVDEFVGAWSPADATVELAVSWGSVTKVRRGRPTAVDVVFEAMDDTGDGSQWARVRGQFDGYDPVWYLAPPKAASVSMPTTGDGVVVASGGVTVASGGVDVVGGAVAGDAAILNAGKAPVDWVATIIGPILNPRVTVDYGIVDLNANVAAGSVGVLDSRRRTFTLNGTILDAVVPTSKWNQIPPGAPTVFSLRGDSGTGTARLVWQDGSYS